MNNTVLVSIISFLGTLVGTAGGILASSRLTQYRIEQLEKKVEAYTKTALKIPIIEERMNNINLRIQNLEKEITHQYFDGS